MIAKASTTCTCSLDPITSLSHRQPLQVEFSRCAVFQLSRTLSSNHLEIHRYNHNPDSFHVHLKDASAIQITYFFQIVKERQPIWCYSYHSDWLNRQCKALADCFSKLLALKIGGGRRDRTDDPLLAKQVLSQLSYAPMYRDFLRFPRQTMVGLVGFEPTTPALSRRCSNRLSYRPLSLS